MLLVKCSRSLPEVCLHRKKQILRRPPDELKKEKGSEVKFFCNVSGCKYNGSSDRVKERYFSSRKLLNQHISKVHMAKNLTCRVCQIRKFSLERDRKYHEQLCQKPKNYSLKPPPSASLSRQQQTQNAAEPQQVVVFVAFPQPAPPSLVVGQELPGACVPRFRKLAPKFGKKDTSAQTSISVVDEERTSRAVEVERCSQSNQCGKALVDTSLLEVGSQACFGGGDTLALPSDYEAIGQDTFSQTTQPLVVDASVCTDLSTYWDVSGRTDRCTNTPAHEWPLFDMDPAIFTTIETQTDKTLESLDFEELLRNIETQTYNGGYLADIETQTSLIDFEGAGISTTIETQTA